MIQRTAGTSALGSPLLMQGVSGLLDRVGTDLGVSSWLTVTQVDVSAFGALTGDEQWIHVDPARARTGPYGTTIQHGFFTLARSTGLLWEVCAVEGFDVVVNYGLNKVRFPAPVLIGSRIRMFVHLAEVRALDGPGAEAVYRLTFEVEGQDKPSCVADLVFRYYN